MAKTRREPLPERICANPSCHVEFLPDRSSQVFHDTPCRKAYWREAVHYAPHACPLCTVVHDPEEAGVLDALDMLIRMESQKIRPATEGGVPAGNGPPRSYLLTHTLEEFLARRRLVLATKPSAPAE